jgi:hypothetical protein
MKDKIRDLSFCPLPWNVIENVITEEASQKRVFFV